VAAGLLQFRQLGLILIGIEEKDAALIGEVQTRRDLRGAQLFSVALGFQFLVEFDGFGSEFARLAALLKLVGRVPVDEGVRDFFPLAAFGAEIADAVAVNLILGNGLVGAIFQDEAVRLVLGESGNVRREKKGEQSGGCQAPPVSPRAMKKRFHAVKHYQSFHPLAKGSGASQFIRTYEIAKAMP